MRKYLTAIAIIAAAALPVAAEQVNLSGTWKLNLASSFMAGEHPAPNYEFTKVLLQQGLTIQQTDIQKHVSIVNIPLPDSRVSSELTADGQEHDAPAPAPFPGMPSAHLKVTAEWQGGTLLVQERNASAGRPSTTVRRYFLSDNGQHLIELIEAHNAFGDTEQRLVFDK
ncbi:MAG: hypothetical protein KGM96_01850 [Acidobacteriota bacterium]|nr:hypothetical protein [Acidobacteriota bacterium]